MGVELLVSLLKGATTANGIRKALLDGSVADQAVLEIAAVSEETAGRLFREAFSLPLREQEVNLSQVVVLLETAVTAGGHAKGLRRYWLCYGIPPLLAQFHRLIWLAVVYQLLGQGVKAVHRVQSAKEILPALKECLESDVLSLEYFPQTRTEQYAGPGKSTRARQAIRRERYAETLAKLAHVCGQVECLGP
ncbi:hypothetical protein [Amycolatopsis sp. NPDC051128]|uniref:hypothetical protein n=1 Tax=Amycolatopsis sp. NPDC051128 TaxID=3155412 RepID=UPI003443764B